MNLGFCVHTIFCLVAHSLARLWVVALALVLIPPAAHSADALPLHICLLSGSAEYASDQSLAEFQQYLETRYAIVCHRAFGKDKGSDLPGLEALERADLMIVFTRRITLPPAQLQRVQRYLASGRPVIGLRTASHAFGNFTEFDREILGGGYQGHYSDAAAQVQLAVGRGRHPVLAGVTPFASRKLYKNPTLADDVVVLLEGVMPDHREPVAWVRQRQGGRVFYTSLGTQEDFAQESFRRLLINAIFWTTKRDEAASQRAPAATNAPAH